MMAYADRVGASATIGDRAWAATGSSIDDPIEASSIIDVSVENWADELDDEGVVGADGDDRTVAAARNPARFCCLPDGTCSETGLLACKRARGTLARSCLGGRLGGSCGF
jgi:hypothetical protein